MTATIPVLLVAAILVAEIAARYVGPPWGVVVDAVVVVATLNFAAVAPPAERSLVLAVAVVAAVRLVALTLPLGGVERVLRYPIIAVPALAATIVAARAAGYSRRDLRLSFRAALVVPTVVAVVVAIALSFVAYPSLGSSLPANSATLVEAPMLALLLGLSTGLFEEILFRGLLQRAALQRLGTVAGLLAVSILFAGVSVDQWSAPALALAFACGLALAALTEATGSIVPAAAAHGSFNVALLMAVPFTGLRGGV